MALVELVLALAILSALAVAGVSWSAATTRAMATNGGRVAWRIPAQASLDLIDRALLLEDVSLHHDERWRVRCERGVLTLRTREVVEGEGGRLTVCSAVRLRTVGTFLYADYLDQETEVVVSRSLVAEVSFLECAAVTMDERSIELTVRIVHATGEAIDRRWSIVSGEVRQ